MNRMSEVEEVAARGADDKAHHGTFTPRRTRRARRTEGPARGVQRMEEQEKYCIYTLTQVSARTKALQSVALSLLEEHVSHCLVGAAKGRISEADQKPKEASDAIARLVRS